MNLFRRIRAWRALPLFKTPEGFTLPYGLSNEDYQTLLRVMNSDDFAIFTKTLDTLVNLNAETLLAVRDPAQAQFLLGKVAGLRLTAEFIDELRLKEQDFLINEQRKSRRSDDASKRRTSTFGTPAWRKRQS